MHPFLCVDQKFDGFFMENSFQHVAHRKLNAPFASWMTSVRYHNEVESSLLRSMSSLTAAKASVHVLYSFVLNVIFSLLLTMTSSWSAAESACAVWSLIRRTRRYARESNQYIFCLKVHLGYAWLRVFIRVPAIVLSTALPMERFKR